MSTNDEIKAVEERLAKRRDVLARRYEDVKQAFSTKAARAARSWPVFAVAGGLAAGFAISRTGRHRRPMVSPSMVQYVPVSAVNGHAPARGRNLFAAIAGIAATALRIGASNEARTFFSAVKRYRSRNHH